MILPLLSTGITLLNKSTIKLSVKRLLTRPTTNSYLVFLVKKDCDTMTNGMKKSDIHKPILQEASDYKWGKKNLKVT